MNRNIILAILLSLLAIHSVSHYCGPSRVPQLAGKSFKIASGPYKKATAVFKFTENSVSWRQCNNYNFKFTQNRYQISITDCISTKIACNDPFESPIAMLMKAAKRFIISGSKIVLIDEKKNGLLWLKQVK